MEVQEDVVLFISEPCDVFARRVDDWLCLADPVVPANLVEHLQCLPCCGLSLRGTPEPATLPVCVVPDGAHGQRGDVDVQDSELLCGAKC